MTKPRYVIVCLIDAASARHMSCYGYHRETTPNMQALTAESVQFRKCFTPASYTMSACGSFHTGRYAENHGAFFLDRRLKDDDLTFAETMRRAGYTTGGWCINMYANSYMNYNIGFDHFDDMKDVEEKRQPVSPDMYNKEYQVHARTERWLKDNLDKQLFAYVHFMPPHEEYETPEKFIYRWAKPYPGAPNTKPPTLMAWEQGKAPYTQQDVEYVRDLYDENMVYADYNVGLFIAKLKELGIWDDTLFFLVSDHGEAFMEHGFTLHNTTVYDEMTHVPLIMKPHKGFEPATKDIGALVELIDIYPTLADMLGVTLPKGTVDGVSFLPLLTGQSDKTKDYAFCRSAHFITPILYVRGLQYKYIHNQMKETRELYDMLADPLESNNIIAERPEVADEMHKLLEPTLEYYRKECEKQS